MLRENKRNRTRGAGARGLVRGMECGGGTNFNGYRKGVASAGGYNRIMHGLESPGLTIP